MKKRILSAFLVLGMMLTMVPTCLLYTSHAANKHQSGRQGQYKGPSGVNQRRPLCGPHQGDPSLFLAPAFFIKEYVKSARNASRGPGPIRRCQSSVLPRKIHWIHRQPAGR